MAKQKILLYLHNLEPPVAASIVFLGEDNVIQQTLLRSDLSQLNINREHDVIVIVPASDILLARAELPKLTQRRLEQALPFALEETLIDDVSQLHFAAGQYTSENFWPVAVIDVEKMAQWMEILKSFQITPAAIIPAPLAIPLTENHWSIYAIDGFCFVRLDHYSGFTCENETLSFYLESKLSENSNAPLQIDIYAEKNITLELKHPTPIIQHKLIDNQFVEALWQGVKHFPYINLLQGHFRTRRKTMESKKLWTYAGYVTLAWIAIGFANHLLSLIVLHHRAATIESKVEQIYKRNFPDASSMIAPEERMQTKLKKLSTQASNESYLILLAHVGKALSQSNGLRLQNLDYRDKQFTLELIANTSDNLDNLIQMLQQQGLSVKQQSAEVAAGRVKAALQINGGGAS